MAGSTPRVPLLCAPLVLIFCVPAKPHALLLLNGFSTYLFLCQKLPLSILFKPGTYFPSVDTEDHSHLQSPLTPLTHLCFHWGALNFAGSYKYLLNKCYVILPFLGQSCTFLREHKICFSHLDFNNVNVLEFLITFPLCTCVHCTICVWFLVFYIIFDTSWVLWDGLIHDSGWSHKDLVEMGPIWKLKLNHC